MRLDGAGAVVTGAGSGIGRAIAARLASEGARVVVNDRDPAAAREVAALIGGLAVAGDVGSPEAVEALVEAAFDHLGEVDLYYSNAGIDRGRGLQTHEEDWELSHQVNVMAHVRAARLVVPRFVERGSGRFVITASAAGLLTLLDAPSYSVTKHASVAFAEWLSATYRHRGVVVQVLCPQGVRTRMLEGSAQIAGVSDDGLLEPEDVAAAVREALDHDALLILPHPQTRTYLERKVSDVDRWLAGVNRLQQQRERDVTGDQSVAIAGGRQGQA